MSSDRKFQRANGKFVTMEELVDVAVKYIVADTNAKYIVTVGTDSQSANKTQMVEVVAVQRCGRGGIFFHRGEFVRKVRSLREKIEAETQRSLTLAQELFDALELGLMDYDVSVDDLDIHFQIHCDVGHKGNTNVLVQEIVGWVQSYGYDCCIKPDSYAASTVADKYTRCHFRAG